MKTKTILKEWKNFLSSSLLLETNKLQIVRDIEALNKPTSKAASKDTNFIKIIVNTFKKENEITIEDILKEFDDYKKFIAPSWNVNKPAKVNVPGLLRDEIFPEETTYSMMVSFINAKKSLNLKSKSYKECLRQKSSNLDFEVIINDSNWIVCYPRTMRGSISLSRSYWNGSRLELDTTVSDGVGDIIGEMKWCTSSSGAGNMFNNLHIARNTHMYYCIKKNTTPTDFDRKLCISFVKNNDAVRFKKGQESVDGNNEEQDKNQFISYLGIDRYNKLFEDAQSSDKLEIDGISYYESISLYQYKTLRKANENNIEDFTDLLEGILKFSRDKEDILELCSVDTLEVIRKIAASRINCPVDILEKLSNDTEEVKSSVASNINCPKHILEELSNENSKYIKSSVASNINCPMSILEKLSSVSEYQVLVKIINNANSNNISLENVYNRLQEEKNKTFDIFSNENSAISSYVIEDNIKKIMQHANCPESVLNNELNSGTRINKELAKDLLNSKLKNENILKKYISIVLS